MTENIDYSRPLPNEIEVSVFGPGVGECIVVHLLEDRWLIIDSCLDENKSPVALSYLNKLGVDYTSVVSQVITHWHDDHIKGASLVLDKCINAEVTISAAMMKQESLSLVRVFQQRSKEIEYTQSGIKELIKIIETVSARKKAAAGFILKFATQDKCLINFGQVSVHSLSPSDASIAQSQLDFAGLLEAEAERVRRVLISPSKNHNSTALWVASPYGNILLGADLEEHGDPSVGWASIIASSGRSSDQAKVFKVPHHGSNTGHNADVWKILLEKNPISAITAFSRSSLPTTADICRIKQYTDQLYLTSKPKPPAQRLDRTVEKLLVGSVKNRRVLGGKVGHIQIRLSPSGSAVRVCGLAKKII